jgi:magnesium-protoporphyrin IX monomethyl ester (oxidative) cyclase
MAASTMKASSALRGARVNGQAPRARVQRASRGAVVRVQAAASTEDLGFKTMRAGVKVASDETLLTPRFYTT